MSLQEKCAITTSYAAEDQHSFFLSRMICAPCRLSLRCAQSTCLFAAPAESNRSQLSGLTPEDSDRRSAACAATEKEAEKDARRRRRRREEIFVRCPPKQIVEAPLHPRYK